MEEWLQDASKFVPYCPDHRNVWSHHFAGIILEAASQVDSVFKATAKLEAPTIQHARLTILDYHRLFGRSTRHQTVVFFGDIEPTVFHPFRSWKQGSKSPAWWIAYNKLKHDRFANQPVATFENALNSVAALLVAIVYSGKCDHALICANLVSPGEALAKTSTGILRDAEAINCVKIESKLFAHPIGVALSNPRRLFYDWQSDSARFNFWWARRTTHPPRLQKLETDDADE